MARSERGATRRFAPFATSPVVSGDRPRNGTVVDKRAKHARRSCGADASLGSQPWECRHHPGRHHRRDQFAGDEQAGWAAGVDGRRNAQGCPGWRGWRSRWRRSRSICGASRRQGRHRAQARGRNTILLKTFGDLLWTTAAKLQVFEMAMAEQTLLSESGGSPIGTKRVAYREAIEAARSKTVADTSGEAERASGSKRARRG